MVSPILELTNINKSFGHVQANKNINLKINKGTIHGIMGENGAGKSTLMSIVFGLYQANSGSIKINGKDAPNGEKAIFDFYKYVSKKNESSINLKITRNGDEKDFSILTEARCRFNYAIDLDNNTFNAYADGNNIVFSLRMANSLFSNNNFS